MLKSRRGAYDGRGNAVLRTADIDSIREALTILGCPPGQTDNFDLYAEGWVDFELEVAVMVVRSTAGEIRSYPTVIAVQANSICRVVVAPARDVPSRILTECERIACKAISSLGDGASGVFGVELFLVRKDGAGHCWEVLLNEVAPRPHNTGHYTQDACATSQFENHLRAISGLPLGDVSMNVGCAASKYIISHCAYRRVA